MGKTMERLALGALMTALVVLAAGAAAVGKRTDPGEILTDTELRSGAESSAPAMMLLPRGTQVQVRGLNGRWARVRTASDREGWVATRDLRIGSAHQAESGGGVGWLRNLTGWLGGGGRKGQTQRTATIGIRGLTPDDVRNASPNPAQVQQLERYPAPEHVARSHAAEIPLISRGVAYYEPKVGGSGSFGAPRSDDDLGPRERGGGG